jgi:hypothetical protein
VASLTPILTVAEAQAALEALQAEQANLQTREKALWDEQQRIEEERREVADRLRALYAHHGVGGRGYTSGEIPTAEEVLQRAEARERATTLPAVVWTKPPFYGRSDQLVSQVTAAVIYSVPRGRPWEKPDRHQRSTGREYGSSSTGGTIDVAATLAACVAAGMKVPKEKP